MASVRQTHYVYWKRENKTESWKFVNEAELPNLISTKGAMFATWVSFDEEPHPDEKTDYENLAVKRFGDLPLDFDAEGNMERARQCALDAIESFRGLGIPQDAFQIYVSGGKGFHIILNREIFGAEDGDSLLPLIYREIVNDILPVNDERFSAVDRSLYCMKMGKMFRLPNVRRENGRHKIPISFEELRDTKNADDFLVMSESPRPLPPADIYSSDIVLQAFRLFTEKKIFVHDMARTQTLPKSKLSIENKEMLPCTRRILNNWTKLNPRTTFNEICFSAIVPSLTEVGYAHEELQFIPEVENWIMNFDGSEGYKSSLEREAHFKSVVSRDRGTPCAFSCGAMLKCMGNDSTMCRDCKARINAWLDAEEEVADSEPHDKNPIVDAMLKSYAWTVIGGKESIYGMSGDFDGEFMTKQAFEGLFANKPPVIITGSDGRQKSIPVARIWREHPHRVTFTKVIFDPSNVNPGKGVLNMWRGFAMQKPIMPMEKAEEGCKLFRHHVEHILCNDNPEAIKFMWAWLADMVKRPGGKKPGSAIVLQGGKGIGKSLIARPFQKIMGKYCAVLASPDRLLSHFNANIADKILLVLEEAVWGGSHEAESRLKSLITESSMVVERKGYDAMQCDCYQRIIMCSNEDWVVPASGDERRFFILRIDGQRQSQDYFKRLFYEIDNGGAECLYAWLLGRKEDDSVCLFEPPLTEGLDDQKVVSFPPHIQWLEDTLSRGELIMNDSGSATKPWDSTISGREAYESYLHWKNQRRLYGVPIGPRQFKKALLGPGSILNGSSCVKRMGTATERFYDVGSLEAARAAFISSLKLSEDYEWSAPNIYSEVDPEYWDEV